MRAFVVFAILGVALGRDLCRNVKESEIRKVFSTARLGASLILGYVICLWFIGFLLSIEYDILFLGEESHQISTNQKRGISVFSLLIG